MIDDVTNLKKFRIEYEDGHTEILFGEDIVEIGRWLLKKLRHCRSFPIKIEEVKE